MSGFALRGYQREAIEAVLEARRRGVRRMVVCLPTGAGKTVIFAHLAKLARQPVLVLAHRQELLEQAREKLQRAVGSERRVELEQGSRRASARADVVVASLRSLHEARLARLLAERRFGLVVYDECHHAPAADNKRILTALGAFEPDWPGTLLGFTATTQRGDGVGLGRVFEKIVYRRGLPEMIQDGYLVELRGYRIATATDLAALSQRTSSAAEDFEAEALAEVVDIQERNALVARSIEELARDRRTIAFCVNVRHARNLRRALNHLGVPTATVHGEMPLEERAQTLARFRRGELACITNVGVLTEGFDDPGVSCIAMARPTRSETLYAQCVGRGTRLFEGKRDCLVLDFVDLSALSLVTLPSLVGLPRDLDLQGGGVEEARKTYASLMDQHPTFELAPGAITLDEIQERAASFNPLGLPVDANLRAISQNAWCSLGRAGLVLHFERRAGKAPSRFLVLDTGRAGKKRYAVRLDGKDVATFTNVEQAVEAVDFELQRLGRHAAQSALPSAAWRRVPITDALRERVEALGPHFRAATVGEALQLLVYEEHARARAVRQRPPVDASRVA